MNPSRIPSLEALLNEDLDFICRNLEEEFGRIAGKQLLITRGSLTTKSEVVHTAPPRLSNAASDPTG